MNAHDIELLDRFIAELEATTSMKLVAQDAELQIPGDASSARMDVSAPIQI